MVKTTQLPTHKFLVIPHKYLLRGVRRYSGYLLASLKSLLISTPMSTEFKKSYLGLFVSFHISYVLTT